MGNLDASLARWHAFVQSPSYSGVAALLAPDAVFRSPFAYKPYNGRAAVAGILATVATVFVDFTYHRQFQAGDSVALEFSARVGELELKGIDLIRFGADGQIVEFEVMIRPANALLALGEEMGRRLGQASRVSG
jgi:hypothetical protein